MATELLRPLVLRHRRGLVVSAAAAPLLVLLAGAAFPFSPVPVRSSELVELTLLADAREKGARMYSTNTIASPAPPLFVFPIESSLCLELCSDSDAVCLDGSPPGYHVRRGFGSGAHNWLIYLQVTLMFFFLLFLFLWKRLIGIETDNPDAKIVALKLSRQFYQFSADKSQGGGWCNTTESCSERKMTDLGSSKFMEAVNFTGILSNRHQENPGAEAWFSHGFPAALSLCWYASFRRRHYHFNIVMLPTAKCTFN